MTQDETNQLDGAMREIRKAADSLKSAAANFSDALGGLEGERRVIEEAAWVSGYCPALVKPHTKFLTWGGMAQGGADGERRAVLRYIVNSPDKFTMRDRLRAAVVLNFVDYDVTLAA